MRSTTEVMPARNGVAAIAGACAFAIVSFVTTTAVNQPARALDYFLCGAAGTFAALLAVFIVILNPAELKTFLFKERRVRRVERAGVGRGSGKHITLGI